MFWEVLPAEMYVCKEKIATVTLFTNSNSTPGLFIVLYSYSRHINRLLVQIDTPLLYVRGLIPSESHPSPVSPSATDTPLDSASVAMFENGISEENSR